MNTVLMCQWFAPTKLSVTFETEGKGRFTPEEIEDAVIRGPRGELLSLNLPTKFVLIANHQVRHFVIQGLIVKMLKLQSRFTPTGGMRGACCTSWAPKVCIVMYILP